MNKDIQSIISKAKRLRRKGDFDLWAIAQLAALIVENGRYGDGAVMKFAAAIKRSGKTVYGMAGAWNTYTDLRSVYNAFNVAEDGSKRWPMLKHFSYLRANLPIDYFKAMGDLIRRLEFSPIEAISYLIDAAVLGYSSDRMVKDIEAEQTKKRPPRPAVIFAKSTGKAIYELELASMSAPDEATAIAMINAAKIVKQSLEESQDERPWIKQARLTQSVIAGLLDAPKVPVKLEKKLSECLVMIKESID